MAATTPQQQHQQQAPPQQPQQPPQQPQQPSTAAQKLAAINEQTWLSMGKSIVFFTRPIFKLSGFPACFPVCVCVLLILFFVLPIFSSPFPPQQVVN